MVLACKDVGMVKKDINLQVNFVKEPIKLNKSNEILSVLLTHLYTFFYYTSSTSVCIYILRVFSILVCTINYAFLSW